uniref:Uncharacterized protein n=1 Tax=Arundo donax TaxID=35708 RepID=A0A0A9GTF6_ARUDO
MPYLLKIEPNIIPPVLKVEPNIIPLVLFSNRVGS